jgi:hypothetical protein
MTGIGYEDPTGTPDDHGPVRGAASGVVAAAGSAVSDTSGAVKEQARQVASEVKSQTRNVAADVRDRVGTEARSQNDRLADGLRRFSDELDEMVSGRDDSPARGVVSQVSAGGRRVADYLAANGPEGVLNEVQDFARRRPGTFLAVAAAAGFVAGRLGKSVLTAASSDGDEGSGGRVAQAVPAAEPSYSETGSSTTYIGSAPPVYPSNTGGSVAAAAPVAPTAVFAVPVEADDDLRSTRQ